MVTGTLGKIFHDDVQCLFSFVGEALCIKDVCYGICTCFFDFCSSFSKICEETRNKGIVEDLKFKQGVEPKNSDYQNLPLVLFDKEEMISPIIFFGGNCVFKRH
jgi:hypothetical protein